MISFNYDMDLTNKICENLTNLNLEMYNSLHVLNCVLEYANEINGHPIIVYNNVSHDEILGYISVTTKDKKWSYENITKKFSQIDNELIKIKTELESTTMEIENLERKLDELVQTKITLINKYKELIDERTDLLIKK